MTIVDFIDVSEIGLFLVFAQDYYPYIREEMYLNQKMGFSAKSLSCERPKSMVSFTYEQNKRKLCNYT